MRLGGGREPVHQQFLFSRQPPPQTCESLNAPLETGDLPAVVVHQEASFLPVQQVILDLRDQVEELCNQELSKIIKQGLQNICIPVSRRTRPPFNV